jgi:transcriptional regulator with XRE-family HTH domain
VNSNNIGERIRVLRQIHGVSQVQLANQLYVSDSTISDWERGRTEPGIIMIIKISAFFHVSLDYLMLGKTKTL